MASKRTRSGTVLPGNPKVGDVFTLLGAPDPDAKCLVDGVWSLHGGSITHDSLALTFQTGTSGITFVIGNYDFAPSDDNFNPAVNFGDVSSAVGAHFALIAAAGAGGGDTTIQISGASVLNGTRIPGDTEDIVLSGTGISGAYYQSTKFWLSELAITKTAGPDLLANYGFVTHYSRNETDFVVPDITLEWLAGASDPGWDFQVLHHKPTGWTYVSSGEPIHAAAVVSLLDELTPDNELVNGKKGDWRIPLNLTVLGSQGEGVLLQAITGTNNSVEFATLLASVVPL